MVAEPQEYQYNADAFEARDADEVKQEAAYKEVSKVRKIKPDSFEDVGEILRPFLMRNNSYSYRSEHRCQLVSEGRHKQRPHAERHSQIGHFLSLQSHITWVMRRSMSMRAVLHSLGYFSQR